jgi:putative Mn2+ efflux pump MntP
MTEYLYILLLALPLGLTAFSNSFFGGVYKCLCFTETLVMAVSFMIFNSGLLWLGGFTGQSFARSLGWFSLPFAEAILLLTGIKLIYNALRVRPGKKNYDLSSYPELIAVSFATGLNAFMAGLGFGMLRVTGAETIAAVAVATLLLAMAGSGMGIRSGRYIYINFAGTIAGIMLIALGALLAMDLYGLF